MLSLSLQRSPRRNVPCLQPKPASRLLHKSASVPRLTLEPPSNPLPRPPQTCPQGSFVLKSGVKHHAFSPDVPYPLSYHRDILACDALDHALLRSLYKSTSAVDFTDRGPPARCLDLGCGLGSWVIEAATQWPDCLFVGFDIVNLQIPPHRLSPKYSSRIKWVQGNFLEPLPFDDDYFDHVHIRHISRGVPENKWDLMMAEVTRVLKVGGSVEIFEEDIIFPVLPRSSTATPRTDKRKRKTLAVPVSASPDAASITTQILPTSLPEHDHAILEALFYRLFERRFINLRPTALIMNTLNMHMQHAGGSPLINFPLPPAPLQDDHSAHMRGSSDVSSRSTTPRMLDQCPVENLTSRSSTPVPDKRGAAEDWQTDGTASSPRRSTMGSSKSTPATSVVEYEHTGKNGDRSIADERPIAFFSDAELTSASRKEVLEVLPQERLVVTSGTMGLNLHRSWQGI
ncbi:hypothetical protein JB92DRAFT_166214 [Gautieria morchelliformis]|nr:hypothetical protein JB92DRAFT_166214 [Gautieria morchelliformis]